MTDPTKKHALLFAHIRANTPFIVANTFLMLILVVDTYPMCTQ